MCDICSQRSAMTAALRGAKGQRSLLHGLRPSRAGSAGRAIWSAGREGGSVSSLAPGRTGIDRRFLLARLWRGAARFGRGHRHLSEAGPGWKANVATLLETFRRARRRLCQGSRRNASSTYHTFLVLLCLELAERQPQEPERIVAFLHSQRAEEGGFREIRASKRAGTNPTAAAIAALQMLGSLDESTREDTHDFLAEMQTDEGGLRANTRIPIADLLEHVHRPVDASGPGRRLARSTSPRWPALSARSTAKREAFTAPPGTRRTTSSTAFMASAVWGSCLQPTRRDDSSTGRLCARYIPANGTGRRNACCSSRLAGPRYDVYCVKNKISR